MKFGVREICEVVLKAKTAQKIGNREFKAGEPVLYFDTLKTSGLEGSATTVYAQGGRGNTKLIAWEGERTVTFTMEDALISPLGFMVLSGAGLIEAGNGKKIQVHVTQPSTIKMSSKSEGMGYVILDQAPSAEKEAGIYVMFTNSDGEIISEPYLGKVASALDTNFNDHADNAALTKALNEKRLVEIKKTSSVYEPTDLNTIKDISTTVFVDYYVDKQSGAQQIEITPDKFGGNYYLEASTLFRTEKGVDLPAEFIIPNCKVQSNFNFTLASSGDPSTFTFTMDAFPDYTVYDNSKKVLAAIQIRNKQ